MVIKDTLCSLPLDKGVPDKAPSGQPKLSPHLRSSLPQHPEKCALCSETSARPVWAHCVCIVDSSADINILLEVFLITSNNLAHRLNAICCAINVKNMICLFASVSLLLRAPHHYSRLQQ